MTNASPTASASRSASAARDVVAAAHAAQPVGDEARDFRPLRAHPGEQAVAVARAAPAVHRPRRRRIGRERAAAAARRRRPSRCTSSSLSSSTRVEPLAQHGLERVFPARLDVESLPQPARVARVRDPRATALSLPWPIFACSAASACDRASMSASALAVALPRVAGRALPRPAAPAPPRAARRAGFLLAGELRRFLRELLFDFARSASVTGRRDRRELAAAAARGAASSCASDCAAFSRRVSMTRIACSASAIRLLQLGERAAAAWRPPARAPAAPHCAARSSSPALLARRERASIARSPRCAPRRAPLPGPRARRSARSSCATCCVIRVSLSRANASCCSSRVTSALAS